MNMNIKGARGRSIPRKIWGEVVKEDLLKHKQWSRDRTEDCMVWRAAIN